MFQGFLWNINSYDQEGVLLGKKLALSALSSNDTQNQVLDSFYTLLT